MKFLTILTTMFAALATASPTFTTTTAASEASIAAEGVAPIDVPICAFDPVKGEYVCPDSTTNMSIESAGNETSTTSKDSTSAAAAAAVEAADWDDCMKVSLSDCILSQV
ncbi:uncharacterized protein EKO05_0001898 [Ascochyta rabiei]|uniref:Uncharacterized protein n=1 Tax=Didymella rabiei TaxID=5454 RepID=A0A163I5H9_DIDRA|nr:uncharacterized protein EKO05_0001898 [Ascochyta rabiei]KZM25618.1 hypothetical protein ST47_g3278 [Ascochyta rabiei]UPX11286.1 hypothetical protein EKO05_0001898 [Ascochyta rabiei]